MGGPLPPKTGLCKGAAGCVAMMDAGCGIHSDVIRTGLRQECFGCLGWKLLFLLWLPGGRGMAEVVY